MQRELNKSAYYEIVKNVLKKKERNISIILNLKKNQCNQDKYPIRGTYHIWQHPTHYKNHNYPIEMKYLSIRNVFSWSFLFDCLSLCFQFIVRVKEIEK